MDKLLLRERILAQLRATLALQVGAAQLARDEAISEESKPENQYDTHSLEAGYLAEGQARQAAEIEESIKILSALAVPDFAADTPLALGAVAEVRDAQGVSAFYFLCPRAGGLELEAEHRTILVVTPQSPLGRQLLGRRVGDPVQLPGRRPTAPARIVAVD
ncbi:MAG: transcription elongation factor [Verrucomicrobiota bacterium]|nr:transcription elongation factor [Opitutales bacterium]